MDKEISDLKSGRYKGYKWLEVLEGILNIDTKDDTKYEDIYNSALVELEELDKNSEKFKLLDKWADNIHELLIK